MPVRSKTPGLKRGRHRAPYWVAKQVVRDPMGFPDKCFPLPMDADEATLSRLCFEHTARLQLWISEQLAEGGPRTAPYDGSVISACRIYQEHPLSRFHKVKRNTRGSYVDSLKIIEATVGKRLIRNLTVVDVQYWYDQWRKPAAPGGTERIDRAHDAVSMFRTVIRFCAALRKPECKMLADELKLVKFEKGSARQEEMNYAQAAAFIRTALEMGRAGIIPAERALHMAIGTTAQFELMLRQKDIIGEWAPAAELTPKNEGIATVYGNEIWTGYFRWERIPGWRWRMKTSKSKYRAAAEFDLQKYSLLFPLLEQVPHHLRSGAIVKAENGLPIRESSHRAWFRQIARAAGIPDEVYNIDSRAGGATEADESGASIEAIQGALTHTKADTTLRDIRQRSSKIAEVAAARSSKRAANHDDGTA